MTKLEMRNEIERINQRIYRELEFETRKAIYERHHELLDHTGINKTKGGVIRYYLPKSASKEVVEDYLAQLINTCYDVLGYYL